MPAVDRLRVDSPQSTTAPAHDPAPVQQAAEAPRPVPLAPVPTNQRVTPPPPAYRGIAQAEALYDYSGSDESDLPFRVGDKILIMEYVNDGEAATMTLYSCIPC